ncbi:MAG: SET domain-containing protein-lysine N-methyltransferase [Archangium sp.]|nr:SET domain-containing protein-lysine N-methyltransferase [Archangium sp.]MDP3155646.1 SET domain-containing protein-lysine N-methyltransferase [Archangium sp.]MDP3570748.1 SET domain-containing protein-lysine N-methyltransferase [Archangium sp.]
MARIAGLEVVRSPVEGYGVIATRHWRAGSVITNVDGVLWRAGEGRDDKYSLILEDGVFFDMVDQTRWVNHSCEPNVVVEAGVTRRGNGWAQLQALREIKPGDELFYDYALPVELRERCHCGARTCRGWIMDAAAVLKAPRTSPSRASTARNTRSRAGSR